ncbi:hypothetical protein Tco_0017492 [Tanacetum coccineum]
MPRYSSNDKVHNHYLEKAKKKTQERGRNSRPSVIPSAISQSTDNGSKPKPRIDNQKSRNCPASKTSCVTTKTVPTANYSRNFRKFSYTKHFVCSTCQKCVFNVNHDTCVTKFLNEVSSRAKASDSDNSGPMPQLQQTSDHNRSELGIHDHNNEPSSSNLVPNVSPTADTTASSLQKLDFLFILLFEEYFTAGNQSVPNSFALSDNSQQQDTQPTTNIQLTTEPITPTTTITA